MPNSLNVGAMPGATAMMSAKDNGAGDIAQQGYKASLAALKKSLALAGTNATGQMADAKTQLANNQGQVQQQLINSGLGNTTVAGNMMQAPLATYNRAVQGIQDSMTGQQMQGYNNLAAGQQGGGQQLGGLLAALQQQQQQASAASNETSMRYKNPYANYV